MKTTMSNLWRTAALLSVLLSASFSATLAAETLRIGVEGAYPPFSQTNADGSISGFDIDITNALCAEMNVECRLVKQDWDGMIPALLARKYDAIIASMSITEERKQRVDFTDKYYSAPARFVRKKGSDITMANTAMQGATVGVQQGTNMENFVTDNYAAFDILTVKGYATQEAANLDLIAGRVQLAFMEFGVAEEFLSTERGQGFEMFGPSFAETKWFGEGIGIAVRKNDDLRERLNTAIAAIRANGTYDAIRAKYFAYDIYGE